MSSLKQLYRTKNRSNFISKGIDIFRTFAMIKPDAYKKIGEIIRAIEEDGFTISNLKMTRMTKADAHEFYKEHKGKSFFEKLVNFMTSDLVVGLELIADDSISKWRKLIGPTNSNVAKKQAPSSIRARFGTDQTKNAVHGSDSLKSAHRELSFFFGKNSTLRTTALFNNCSCCVIKPHSIKERNAGKIISQILSDGYEISAMQMFYLDKPSVAEFLEVY